MIVSSLYVCMVCKSGTSIPLSTVNNRCSNLFAATDHNRPHNTTTEEPRPRWNEKMRRPSSLPVSHPRPEVATSGCLRAQAEHRRARATSGNPIHKQANTDMYICVRVCARPLVECCLNGKRSREKKRCFGRHRRQHNQAAQRGCGC